VSIPPYAAGFFIGLEELILDNTLVRGEYLGDTERSLIGSRIAEISMNCVSAGFATTSWKIAALSGSSCGNLGTGSGTGIGRLIEDLTDDGAFDLVDLSFDLIEKSFEFFETPSTSSTSSCGPPSLNSPKNVRWPTLAVSGLTIRSPVRKPFSEYSPAATIGYFSLYASLLRLLSTSEIAMQGISLRNGSALVSKSSFMFLDFEE